MESAVLDRPPVSLLEVVDTVQAQCARVSGADGKTPGAQRASTREIEVLESLRRLLIDETATAFRRATPDTIETIADELSRRHARQWDGVLKLVLALAEAHGIATVILHVPAKQWQRVGHEAETLYPHLPRKARRDLRSLAFFYSEMLGLCLACPPLGEATLDRVRLDWSRPVELRDPSENRRLVYHMVLSVAGQVRDSGIDPAVSTAVADALWSETTATILENGPDVLRELVEVARGKAAMLEHSSAESEKSARDESDSSARRRRAEAAQVAWPAMTAESATSEFDSKARPIWEARGHDDGGSAPR